MKLFGRILSVYMIILAVVPCCLLDNCPDDKTLTEQTGGHQPGDKDCGSCSPFFNCGQCATATVTMETMSINYALSEVKPVYTEFTSPSIPDLQYEFWQPPKLG